MAALGVQTQLNIENNTYSKIGMTNPISMEIGHPTLALTGGVTPLMQACQQAKENAVRQLIHRDPTTLVQRDRTGKTAIHYCVENTNVSCLDQLLKAEPSLVTAKDDEGYTALHLATIAGNRPVIRYLLSRGADIHAKDDEEHTSVHWATVCGEVEVLDLLIDAGGDPETPDIHGAYPIHYAAQMCGPHSELGHDVHVGLHILQKLLQRGASVSVTDHDGRQPLLWAASAEVRPSHVYCPSGSADAILALINAGADVAAEDKDGLTALHCAASRGHLDCLDVLINLCSAEVDTLDSNGCTPLFYAATLGHADCTELLLNHGADPDRQDRKGRTPAHCGAAKGQLETLKMLHRRDADMWKRNVKGDLPFHEACQSGRKDLILWLLSLMPEAVNIPNNDGRCPLHIAAINNNIETCKIIMDHKASVNPIMRNSRGQLMTPVDAAVARGNRGCAKYLQLHGGLPASKLTDKRALQIAMQQALESGPVIGHTGATPSDLTGGDRTTSSTPNLTKSPSMNTLAPNVYVVSESVSGEDEEQDPGTEEAGSQTDKNPALSDDPEKNSLSDDPEKNSLSDDPEKNSLSDDPEKLKLGDNSSSSEGRTESTNRSEGVKEVVGGVAEGKDPNLTLKGNDNKDHAVDNKSKEVEINNNLSKINEEEVDTKGTLDKSVSKDSYTESNAEKLEDREESSESRSEALDNSKTITDGDKETSDNTESEFESNESQSSKTTEDSRTPVTENSLEGSDRVSEKVVNEDDESSSVSCKENTVRENEVDTGDLDSSEMKTEEKTKDDSQAATDSRNSEGNVSVSEQIIPKDDRETEEEKSESVRSDPASDSDETIKNENKTTDDSAASNIEDNDEIKDKEKHGSSSSQVSEEIKASDTENLNGTPNKNRTSSLSVTDESDRDRKKTPNSQDKKLHKAKKSISQESKSEEATKKTKRLKKPRSEEVPEISAVENKSGSSRRKSLGEKNQKESQSLEDDDKSESGRGSEDLETSDAEKTEDNGEKESPSSLSVPERELGDGASEDADTVSGLTDDKDSEAKKTKKSPLKRLSKSSANKSAKNKNSNGNDYDNASSTEETSSSQEEEEEEEDREKESKKKLFKRSSRPRTAIRKSPSQANKGFLKGETTGEKTFEINLNSSGRNFGLVRDSKVERAQGIPKNNKKSKNKRGKEASSVDNASKENSEGSSSDEEGNEGKKGSKRRTKKGKSKAENDENGNEGSGGSSSSDDSEGNDEDGKEESRKKRLGRMKREDRIAKSLNGVIDSEDEGTSDSEEEDGGEGGNKLGNRTATLRRGKREMRMKYEYSKKTKNKNKDDMKRIMSGGPTKVEAMDRNLRRDPTTEMSITRAMQTTLRKYSLERRLFQQLLDLKRLQIRKTRANEHVVVKRLVDEFNKEGRHLGLKDYSGPLNFSSYEKYLYDQLRVLQSNDTNRMPRFRSNDDVDKLARTLRKSNISTDYNRTLNDREKTAQNCNRTTHRCHHAIHAYTGVPCAAYLSQYKKNLREGKIPTNLPKLPPPVVMAGDGRESDSKKPLKVELQHGKAKQQISLPTNFLDKSQKYQLTVSIQPSAKASGRKNGEKEGDILKVEEKPSSAHSVPDLSQSSEPPSASKDIRSAPTDGTRTLPEAK